MSLDTSSKDELVAQLCGHGACAGKGTYEIAVKCTNCGWAGDLKLTKGHSFSRFAHDCPRCGCSDLIGSW